MNKKIKGILVGLSVLGNVVMVGNAIKVDTAVEEQIISGVVSVQEVVAEEKQEIILEEEVEEVEIEKEIEVVEEEVKIVEKEVEVVKEVEVEKEVIKEVKSEPVEVEVVVEEIEIEEEVEIEEEIEEEIEVVVEEEIENKDEVIINNMFDIDDEEYVLALKATTFSYNDIGYTVLSDGYGSLYIVDTTLKNGQNYVGKIDGMTDTLVEYRESDFEFVYQEYFEEYSQEEIDWAIGRLEGKY